MGKGGFSPLREAWAPTSSLARWLEPLGARGDVAHALTCSLPSGWAPRVSSQPCSWGVVQAGGRRPLSLCPFSTTTASGS